MITCPRAYTSLSMVLGEATTTMQFETKYQRLLARATPHIQNMDEAVRGVNQVRQGLIQAANLESDQQVRGQLISLYMRFGSYIDVLKSHSEEPVATS